MSQDSDNPVASLDIHFLCANFLHVVWVLFVALYICLSSSVDLSLVSVFWAFNAPQGSWDILFNPLETTADFHFLGSMGLIKCQNVCVGPDLLCHFSYADFSYVCHAIFLGQLPSPLLKSKPTPLSTYDDSSRSVQFLHLVVGNLFYLEDVFDLPPTAHFDKQVSILFSLRFVGLLSLQ